MLTLSAPAAFNGAQLRRELAAAGYTLTAEDVSYADGQLSFAPLDGRSSSPVQAVLDAHVPQPEPELATTATIDDRIGTALDQLRTFINTTKPSTTAAQASAAYDAARLCARVLVGLIRLRLRRLDTAD